MARSGISKPTFQGCSVDCIVKVADYTEKNKHFHIASGSSIDELKVLASIQKELDSCPKKYGIVLFAKMKYEFVEFDHKSAIKFVIPII
jgi:hypothetical protein